MKKQWSNELKMLNMSKIEYWRMIKNDKVLSDVFTIALSFIFNLQSPIIQISHFQPIPPLFPFLYFFFAFEHLKITTGYNKDINIVIII